VPTESWRSRSRAARPPFARHAAPAGDRRSRSGRRHAPGCGSGSISVGQSPIGHQPAAPVELSNPPLVSASADRANVSGRPTSRPKRRPGAGFGGVRRKRARANRTGRPGLGQCVTEQATRTNTNTATPDTRCVEGLPDTRPRRCAPAVERPHPKAGRWPGRRRDQAVLAASQRHLTSKHGRASMPGAVLAHVALDHGPSGRTEASAGHHRFRAG